MKTFSNKLDGPEARPQQITGHDLTDNNASEKASSHFLKEHQNIEISSNQVFNFKKKLTLLITIAIALAAFLMTACEDDQVCSNCPGTTPTITPTPTPTDPIVIRSINPSAGAPGSKVNIFIENFSVPDFSDSSADQYVTFGPTFAETIYARHGMLIVRVPMDLEDGDYTVNVRYNGQIVSAPGEFKVIKGIN